MISRTGNRLFLYRHIMTSVTVEFQLNFMLDSSNSAEKASNRAGTFRIIGNRIEQEQQRIENLRQLQLACICDGVQPQSVLRLQN